jgi:hypothetical protein
VEFKEQDETKIENMFATLESLDDNVDINREQESIRVNINVQPKAHSTILQYNHVHVVFLILLLLSHEYFLLQKIYVICLHRF